MEVVNVKVKYIRKEGYDNLKEWMKDDANEYIGRRGVVIIEKRRYPEKGSIWGNPFKVGKDGTLEEVLGKYEKYISEKIEKDEDLRCSLMNLKNKRLGCWCKPNSCHGDVLKRLIEKYDIDYNSESGF